MELQELTPTEFRNFQKFIYEMSGIRIPDTKRALLNNRVRRRLRAGEFDDFQSYFKHLRSSVGQDELTDFLDAITTNETYFFRTEKHFRWFLGEFINQAVSQARRGERAQSLRIWSAACSTGEEPYSLAICLAENQLRLRDWKLEIVATDLSRAAVHAARRGIYKQRALQNVAPKRLRRHFTKQKDEPLWRIKPNLQELVSFQEHNLLNPPPESPFDCIFIRNVLIYFDQQSKQRVVKNLVGAMAEGGYLVVGPSEGIYEMLSDLVKHSTFLYQR